MMASSVKIISSNSKLPCARSARRVARICSFSVSSANSCGTWTGSGCLISSLRLLMMRLTTFLTSLNSIADKKHKGRSQMMNPASMMELWKMILLCKRAAFRFPYVPFKKNTACSQCWIVANNKNPQKTSIFPRSDFQESWFVGGFSPTHSGKYDRQIGSFP